MEPVRLQKYLARSGVASRRASEDLITSGRVRVNGEVVTELGTKVVPGTDVVECDGNIVEPQDTRVVLMLNKPAGYLTAMSDNFGKRCVSELVPTDTYPGLYPIGRLDKNTTGLLLFTNDGELGNALIHPRHHVGKTYRAWVKGTIGNKVLDQLRAGVLLDDGITQPAKARLIERTPKTSLVELTIYEGRYRQVRRMFAALHHPVETLERIQLGPLFLGSLEQGKWRLLTPEEDRALIEATGLSRDRITKEDK